MKQVLLLSTTLGICALLAFSGCTRQTTRKGGFPQAPMDSAYGTQTTAESRLRLHARHYVESSLRTIYGPSIEAITTELILANVGHFGSPCDPYLSQNECAATERSASQASMVPLANTSRAALMIRACDRIHDQSAAIEFAINQVTAAATPRLPTDADIAAAYELYNPGRVLTEDVAAEFRSLVQEAGTPLESWRFLLLTLCQSPDWHIS